MLVCSQGIGAGGLQTNSLNLSFISFNPEIQFIIIHRPIRTNPFLQPKDSWGRFEKKKGHVNRLRPELGRLLIPAVPEIITE